MPLLDLVFLVFSCFVIFNYLILKDYYRIRGRDSGLKGERFRVLPTGQGEHAIVLPLPIYTSRGEIPGKVYMNGAGRQQGHTVKQAD